VFHVTIQDVAALIGGSGTFYASVRGIPMLANFLKKQVRLMRERDLAIEERDAAIALEQRATKAAESFELAAKGWKTALEAIGDEVAELRTEVRESREEVHESREDLRRTRELLAAAIQYITSLHTFLRLGGNMPEMPLKLRTEIDAILKNKDLLDLHGAVPPKPQPAN
jgi:hypothetical protein